VIAVCHRHPVSALGIETIVADLTEPSAMTRLLSEARPDWVVHCAAAVDVDRCERDPSWASRLNVEMAAGVADACRRLATRLVHISTDAVYDGERQGYTEQDPPRPVNVYGRTKLEGEKAVLAAHPDAVALRANFFGWHAWGHHGLAEWFLGRLESGRTAPGFVDAVAAPLLANALAEMILAILGLPLRGVYNAVARDCVTKYEFGRNLAREFGYDETLVRPSRLDQAGLKARRPRNLCLDTSRLGREASLVLPGVQEGIAAFRRLRETGYVSELKTMAAKEGQSR
jgi:dTDP-4-dehydrorhamnose reductase